MNNSINVELQEASNYDNFAINNHCVAKIV
jgi:hypothetical protein